MTTREDEKIRLFRRLQGFTKSLMMIRAILTLLVKKYTVVGIDLQMAILALEYTPRG